MDWVEWRRGVTNKGHDAEGVLDLLALDSATVGFTEGLGTNKSE
jgi:hypothetical protein